MEDLKRIKYKRGYVNPQTGLVFWHYANKNDKKGNWITVEELNKRKKRRGSYYQKNKDKIIKATNDYYQKNKKNIFKRKNEYKKRMLKTNPMFALKYRLRDRLRSLIKTINYRANTKSYKMIGCDKETLLKWFESFFNEDVNWNTIDKWHIDHIIPLSLATNEEELIKLCHYTNLQPLMAIDNLKKGNKII